MIDYAVVIAGCGPAGMMLAAELALAGVDVAIVERRADQHVIGSRAGGLHTRTIEVLDQRGVAERFLSAGKTGQVAGFAWVPLDMSDFPTRHPYGLGLWQQDFERILAGWVDELGVPVLRSREVSGFTQDAQGVDVALSDGRTLRADYLVGCDGGRSLVRKAAGIAFPGSPPTLSNLIAEVHVADEPAWGLRHDARGVHAFSRLEGEETVRVLVTEPEIVQGGEPTLADLSTALTAVFGTDYGVHSPVSISRFTDATRQAARYRDGRVLLAGDAAHIHYPAGGQGLNLGVQDAVNLGWKLARVINGTSPESLLDSYEAERRPVVDRVLRNTMAQVMLLGRLDDRKTALRAIMAELLAMDEPRIHFAAMIAAMDVHYALGGTHELVGRRMPDLDVTTKQGPTRVYAFLHTAQPVLLNFGALGALDRVKSVQVVDASCDGPWLLPVISAVKAPTAVLVRPDGYVAWVGEGSDDGLDEALARWFGRS